MMVQSKKGNLGGNAANAKVLPLEDALAILMKGFLQGIHMTFFKPPDIGKKCNHTFLSGGSGSGLIKGGTPITQEVRVGVTHCYVIMVQTLGSSWLEKNLSLLLNHVLELASHPKAATTHVDAVYSRYIYPTSDLVIKTQTRPLFFVRYFQTVCWLYHPDLIGQNAGRESSVGSLQGDGQRRLQVNEQPECAPRERQGFFQSRDGLFSASARCSTPRAG